MESIDVVDVKSTKTLDENHCMTIRIGYTLDNKIVIKKHLLINNKKHPIKCKYQNSKLYIEKNNDELMIIKLIRPFEYIGESLFIIQNNQDNLSFMAKQCYYKDITITKQYFISPKYNNQLETTLLNTNQHLIHKTILKSIGHILCK